MSQNTDQKDLISVRAVRREDREGASARAMLPPPPGMHVHHGVFDGYTAYCGWGEPTRHEGAYLATPDWTAVTCPECLARRAFDLAAWEAGRAAAPRGLCIGDCATGRPENRPSFVAKVDEDGLCLTCGGDVVLVALGDAEAIMRALAARRCDCKPAPRHVEACPLHDPARR